MKNIVKTYTFNFAFKAPILSTEVEKSTANSTESLISGLL